MAKSSLKFEVRLEVTWSELGILIEALENVGIEPTHVARIFYQDTQPPKVLKPPRPARETPSGRAGLTILASGGTWPLATFNADLAQLGYAETTGQAVLSKLVQDGDAERPATSTYRIT